MKKRNCLLICLAMLMSTTNPVLGSAVANPGELGFTYFASSTAARALNHTLARRESERKHKHKKCKHDLELVGDGDPHIDFAVRQVTMTLHGCGNDTSCSLALTESVSFTINFSTKLKLFFAEGKILLAQS